MTNFGKTAFVKRADWNAPELQEISMDATATGVLAAFTETPVIPTTDVGVAPTS